MSCILPPPPRPAVFPFSLPRGLIKSFQNDPSFYYPPRAFLPTVLFHRLSSKLLGILHASLPRLHATPCLSIPLAISFFPSTHAHRSIFHPRIFIRRVEFINLIRRYCRENHLSQIRLSIDRLIATPLNFKRNEKRLIRHGLINTSPFNRYYFNI